jgi:tRNA(Arg) A34 adenosine deaminase TadA
VVAESINRVKHDSDVTRHAEIAAISAAQKSLGSTHQPRRLRDLCSAEPCVFCRYAIRESRIGPVVYGLHSPHMGGLSKWNVLARIAWALLARGGTYRRLNSWQSNNELGNGRMRLRPCVHELQG